MRRYSRSSLQLLTAVRVTGTFPSTPPPYDFADEIPNAIDSAVAALVTTVAAIAAAIPEPTAAAADAATEPTAATRRRDNH